MNRMHAIAPIKMGEESPGTAKWDTGETPGTQKVTESATENIPLLV